MQKLIIGICIALIMSLLGVESSWAAQSAITVKGKVPEGVMIGKNKVTLKKGYTFEKVSSSRVVSRMRGGRGGITGDFDCTCNGESGGCSVVTTPTSVSCVASGCKSSCYMIVTIPGTGSVMH